MPTGQATLPNYIAPVKPMSLLAVRCTVNTFVRNAPALSDVLYAMAAHFDIFFSNRKLQPADKSTP